MKFPVTVHKSNFGYDVHCPLLPGCHSQGDTLAESLANIQDAIKTYLEMISEEEQGKLYEVEVNA
jgi:predicted RNase H-like HicB family nuclease